MACQSVGGMGHGAMLDAPRAAVVRWLRGCIIARLLAEAGDTLVVDRPATWGGPPALVIVLGAPESSATRRPDESQGDGPTAFSFLDDQWGVASTTTGPWEGRTIGGPLGSGHGQQATHPGPGGEAEKRSKERTMKQLRIGLLLVVLGSGVMGCANMTPRQQRALSGGAIGAAGGAAVGAIVGGSPAIGAAIGGAAGAATGALIK
jgi:osmotically inducible lipoprotein OsmB